VTIKELADLGADTNEGVKRCAGNEAFYLMMIPKAIDAGRYKNLEESINVGDLDKAFEEAHALKGILANLSLTPILKPVDEITELLRSRQQTDYSGLISEMWDKRNSFEKILRRDKGVDE